MSIVAVMSDTQSTSTGPQSADDAEKSAQTTDADRTATSAPDGDLDEAGEDEQVEEGFIDRALDAEPVD